MCGKRVGLRRRRDLLSTSYIPSYEISLLTQFQYVEDTVSMMVTRSCPPLLLRPSGLDCLSLEGGDELVQICGMPLLHLHVAYVAYVRNSILGLSDLIFDITVFFHSHLYARV